MTAHLRLALWSMSRGGLAVPQAELSRTELIERIQKHVKLSPMQLRWSTASLRIVLDAYDPAQAQTGATDCNPDEEDTGGQP